MSFFEFIDGRLGSWWRPIVVRIILHDALNDILYVVFLAKSDAKRTALAEADDPAFTLQEQRQKGTEAAAYLHWAIQPTSVDEALPRHEVGQHHVLQDALVDVAVELVLVTHDRLDDALILRVLSRVRAACLAIRNWTSAESTRLSVKLLRPHQLFNESHRSAELCGSVAANTASDAYLSAD